MGGPRSLTVHLSYLMLPVPSTAPYLKAWQSILPTSCSRLLSRGVAPKGEVPRSVSDPFRRGGGLLSRGVALGRGGSTRSGRRRSLHQERAMRSHKTGVGRLE
eukprot:1291137-Pyramimonas_sp.AAC.2